MDYTDLRVMLLNHLKDQAPTLDLHNSPQDKRVYHIADQDLRNYVVWLHRIQTGEDSNEYDIIAGSDLDPQETDDFVKMWTIKWLKKWRERTKLVLTPDDQMRYKTYMKEHRASRGHRLPEVLPPSILNEMSQSVSRTLIKLGEVCGTKILGQQLLDMEFRSKEWEKQRISGKMNTQDIINLTTAAKKRAKQMAYTHGPLIFIRIQDYKVREFRNHNNGKVN